MRGPFRYISVDKLNAMSSPERWWGRMTVRAKASVPAVVALDATVEPRSLDWPARVVEVERALRKSKQVRSAREITTRKSGMFEFEGPAVLVAAGDAFWAATVADGIAILLVGSLKHVIGGTPPRTPPPLSPSMDPTPAIRALVTGRGLDRHTDSIERAWIHILKLQGVADLLPVRGVAEYRACTALPGLYWEGHRLDDLLEPTAPLVLGSPLWVEAA